MSKSLFEQCCKRTISLLFVYLLMSAFTSAKAELYDIVIRNGRVLDGAGNPWVHADVAVNNGRFAKIGRVEGKGRQEIDATGNYVTPGWIDMMDQSAYVLRKNGLAKNKVLMGVTTAIAGENKMPVPTHEISHYFQQLEEQGISINFANYYAAWQARVEVMGSVAGEPTREQMNKMKGLVAAAMEAGAFGISTALIYPPSSFQTTQELIELAEVVSRYDGFYASHMRDESAYLINGIEEAIEIGEQAKVAVEIFHLKAAFQPKWGTMMKEAGKLIDAARARGLDIAADMYPYTAGGTGLDATVPTWIFADGEQKGLERLKDPVIRKRIKNELAAGSDSGWSNMVEASGGWDNVILANANSSEYSRYHLRSIADIAAERGEHPADLAWDMVLAASPKRAMALYFMMSEKDIETALRFPWTSIGSDAAAAEKLGEVDDLGLPHPRSYGTFPRIIAEYVRKREVLTLPDAIRKMTSWPASRMKLFDRGLIRTGLKADVVIFDYERIEDKSNWDSPMALPTGIEYVLVNGVTVVAQGKHTGATPGEVLRGPGYAGSLLKDKPQKIRAEWADLIGEYSARDQTITVSEKQGLIHVILDKNKAIPLEQADEEKFKFPPTGQYANKTLSFTKSNTDATYAISLNGMSFLKNVLNERGVSYKPVKPVTILRQRALKASPPQEKGEFKQSDLVDITQYADTIKLDIRYAGSNNFIGAQVYSSSHAFLQRPAAQALGRVASGLKSKGYGLLVYDAYRPWYVSKIFWDATPQERKIFVADPSKGSRHNRGAAIDLTLYDLKSGEAVEMTGLYDEMTRRSYPDYPGGTSLQRWHRDLLRGAMEKAGFKVYDYEWWHFDFDGWENYRIQNDTFEKLNFTR